MNAAMAIAADATTRVNPGVSSDAGPSPISPPSWKVSSQDAGSTGNNKLPLSPSSISKAAGFPLANMILLIPPLTLTRTVAFPESWRPPR